MLASNHNPIPILTYHQISELPAKDVPFRELHVTPGAFAQQMSLLARHGYTGCSMTALQPYLNGKRTGKVVGITFDDGYTNNLQHAMPILRDKGFSSTCYVVSNLIGKTNLWDVENGIPESGLMNDDQLREWIQGGQEVGSHTLNHIRLPFGDDDLCRKEIANAKVDIERVTGQAVLHFAYPYGAYDARHMTMIQESGYATATTTRRARCKAQADLLQLPRIPILCDTSLLMLLLYVATDYTDVLDGARTLARSGRRYFFKKKLGHGAMTDSKRGISRR